MSISAEATFAGVLRRRARDSPERLAFLFLSDGDLVENRVTYGQLHERACAIAAVLRGQCDEHSRVMLMFPSSVDFLVALFGCFYANVAPVPVSPIDRVRGLHGLRRTEQIARDAQVSVVLTTSAIEAQVREATALSAGLAQVPVVFVDKISSRSPATDVDPQADGVALIQYTSGSTGDPKGVVLKHRQLIANQRMIGELFRSGSDDVAVGWLPFFHDMGLIGYLLHPIWAGFPSIMMSPLHFLHRPVRWLRAISRYGGTIAGGPNFGFDTCMQRITPSERAELNLSSWRVAFCGAEPIRADTLAGFIESYRDYGFKPESFHPCYGLAEAALVVTAKKASRFVVEHIDVDCLASSRVVRRKDGLKIVSSGGIPAELCVEIVDPQTRRPVPRRLLESTCRNRGDIRSPDRW
jgi:acyl-CoA synthetase (AMP-forming)/AMP-acid ligase II